MTKDFKIVVDWEDPQGARGEELSATWSSISIVIDGKSITQILDAKSKSVRNNVYVPAYPMAEWLAFNWWPLLHESGTGDPSSNGGFKKRHNLKYAAEGFALPDLAFVADGVAVHTKWNAYSPAASTASFLSQGFAVIDQNVFLKEITNFIEVVIARLKEKTIHDCPLIDEWKAIESIDSEEEEFCRAAGALGLDPFALDGQTRDTICSAEAELPNSAIDDFFQVADPIHLERQIDWLLKILGYSERSHKKLRFPSTCAQTLPEGEPWQQGYKLAQQTRENLGLVDWNTPLNLEFLETSKPQDLLIVEADPDLRTDAVSIFEPDGSVKIAFTASSPATIRFVLARSFCDYVLNAKSIAHSKNFPLLQTRAGTHKQRRNRAFAAEFLAPWSGIKSIFNRHEADYRDVERVAEHFLVSNKVIEHQMQNHGIRVLSDW